MKKTEDIIMHPLWIVPVMVMMIAAMIQGLHTVTHWRMEMDADSYCKNNAEWIESNTNEDY